MFDEFKAIDSSTLSTAQLLAKPMNGVRQVHGCLLDRLFYIVYNFLFLLHLSPSSSSSISHSPLPSPLQFLFFSFTFSSCRISTAPLVQFAGLWYVIELSFTSSNCYTMDFSISNTSGVYRVEDSKRLWYDSVVNVDAFVVNDHLYTITGDGKMTIKSQPGG